MMHGWDSSEDSSSGGGGDHNTTLQQNGRQRIGEHQGQSRKHLSTNVSKHFRTISMSGHGSIEVLPDFAHVRVNLTHTATLVSEAWNTVSATSVSVLEELERFKVNMQTDVQTSQFSIQEHFERKSDNTRVHAGFTASVTISVKIRELDITGNVIQKMINTGGNHVRLNDVEFGADDIDTKRSEARAIAIANMRNKATLLANMNGVKLGPPLTLREHSAQRQRHRSYGMSELQINKQSGEAVQIVPGMLFVNATVSGVFELSTSQMVENGP
jgi:uncharacterized protein YggE